MSSRGGRNTPPTGEEGNGLLSLWWEGGNDRTERVPQQAEDMKWVDVRDGVWVCGVCSPQSQVGDLSTDGRSIVAWKKRVGSDETKECLHVLRGNGVDDALWIGSTRAQLAPCKVVDFAIRHADEYFGNRRAQAGERSRVRVLESERVKGRGR